MRKPFILALLTLSSCSLAPSGTDRNSEGVDSTLRAINKKLELVNQKQGIVSVASRSSETMNNIADNRRIQNRITGNIVLIDSVMNDNRNRLFTLEQTVGSHRRKIAALEKEISGMSRRIETKQREIASLKSALGHAESLKTNLHDSLRTAYVLAAPQDSLAKWRIIEKHDGGFFGIFGDSWRLSGHIPLRRFTRVNRLTAYRISVPAKPGSFSVLTLHNQKSYSIATEKGTKAVAKKREADASVIVINSPNEFWAASNILVIKLSK